VTDHRIGLTVHELTQILDGEIGPLIEALRQADTEERLSG
jgi:peptide chain release factor 1